MKFDETSSQTLAVLGSTIRDRRLFLKLSQIQLAEKSGIHQTYLSDLERGLRNPSIMVFIALAEALDMSLGQLTEIFENEYIARRAKQKKDAAKRKKDTANQKGSAVQGKKAAAKEKKSKPKSRSQTQRRQK